MLKDTIMPSCRGALSSSRTHTEEGHGSHFATLRSQSAQEEEKDLVLEAFASNLKDKSVQSEDLHKGNCRIIGKHSTNSPCFQALTPYSPSESDSSSTFSTLGSSSSSSLFSETGSFAVGELSPASTVGSTDVKSVKISPARRSLQRTNLGSKLDAAVCAENWEGSKELLKCTLPKPALNNLLTEEDALDDGFVEFSFLEGNMIETEACKKNRESNSAYSGRNYPHYDKGPRQASKTEEYPSCSDNADHPHCAIQPLAAANTEAFSRFSSPNRSHSADKGTREASNRKISDKERTDGLPIPAFVSVSSGSPEVCSDTYHSSGGTAPASTEPATKPELKQIPSYNRGLGYKHKRDYSNVHFNKDKCQMQKDGLMEQCHAGSKHRRGCSNACGKKGRCSMQCHHGSFELFSHVKSSTQALPMCVTECSSSPYEADIGVNTVSLKSHAFSMSPLEKISLPRALSLYQPLHTHGKVLSFEPPLKPKPKLNTTFSSSNLLNQEMPYKRGLVDRCAFADLVLLQRKGSPRRDLSDRRPLTTPVFDRSLSIIHPHDDIQRFAKASLVRPVSKIHLHDDIPKLRELSPLLSSDGKYVEKADDFTPDSPVEAKYSEGHGGSIPDPHVIFSSKGQWDWRSKSIGARASLKSAARNLEAAFVGSRSVSLPKTRSPTPKKDPKPESARLLDRVFASPMRSRSKQADILKSIERPPHPKGQCNNKDSGVALRRDANPSPSDIHSHHAMACVPIRPVLPPTGHKHRKSHLEVSCKPLLPVSRSVHCLPAPKGALGLDNPISSRQKKHGLSSNESGAASPFMLQAYLRCAVRDGHPCYTMTIEGSEEMLLARACTLENHPSTEGCKWLYSFHSGNSKVRGTGTGGWRSWIRKDNKTASDLTGVMQVSSVLRPEVVPDTGEVRHLMVSELVLYDGRAAESAHGQSLRFYSSDLPCQKRPIPGLSRESPSSSSNVSSEHILSSSPSHSEMAEKQHSSSDSLSNPKQASSPHKGSGGHRPNFSLDVWSESDLPDSKAQELSPCPPLHMELAAMVIQVPAKDPQRESNVADSGHTEQSSRGWGLNFLDGGSESELSSGVLSTLSLSAGHVENIVKYGTTALGQALAGTDWPHAELRPHPSISSSNHNGCSKGVVCVESQKASHLSTMEVSHAQKAENFQHGMLRSSDWITLILPMGDHGLPNGGARGPSSLIERWRSGGSCECGGWDLGCGLKVLSTGSPNKYATSDKNTIKQPLSHDQPLRIFSQGSRQELMVSLSLVKRGFFKLSFQGQLSPLIAFATAVAILQNQQSPSPPSSPTEAWMKADHLKERPPPPPQSHTVTQRRSDFSSKDKAVSAFLELYKNFPSSSVTNPLSPFARI